MVPDPRQTRTGTCLDQVAQGVFKRPCFDSGTRHEGIARTERRARMKDIERGDENSLNDSPKSPWAESFSFPPKFEKLFEQFYREHIATIDQANFWVDLPRHLNEKPELAHILALGLESFRDQFEPGHTSGASPDEESQFDRADASIDEEEKIKQVEERQMERGKVKLSDQAHLEHAEAYNNVIADFLRIDMFSHLLKFAPKSALTPHEILKRGYRARFAELLAAGAPLESLFSEGLSSGAPSAKTEYFDKPEIQPYDIRPDLTPEARATFTKNLEALTQDLFIDSDLDFKSFPVQLPALAKFYAPELFQSFRSDKQFLVEFRARCERALAEATDQGNFENALAAAVNLMLLYPDGYGRESLLINDAFLGRINIVDSAVKDKFGEWFQEGRNDQVFLALLFSKLFFDTGSFEMHLRAAETKLRGSILGLKLGFEDVDFSDPKLDVLTSGFYATLITNNVAVRDDRFEIVPLDEQPPWL